MPRAAIEDSERLNMRVNSEQKARLVRAASLSHTDLTNFVLQPALRVADEVIAQAEKSIVSERDYMRVLELLDKPPEPNDRLRAAARALPSHP